MPSPVDPSGRSIEQMSTAGTLSFDCFGFRPWSPGSTAVAPAASAAISSGLSAVMVTELPRAHVPPCAHATSAGEATGAVQGKGAPGTTERPVLPGPTRGRVFQGSTKRRRSLGALSSSSAASSGDRSARSAATAHRASTAKLAATESKVRIAGAILAEKNAPNFTWYVDVVFRML